MRRILFTIICMHVALLAFLMLGTGGTVTDVCQLPPDDEICYVMYVAWYYDPTVMECRDYIYGGCRDNGNTFKTEAECYRQCEEKLINLYPPKNVTVAYILKAHIFLYWYPPHNYKVHDVTTTDNVTYTLWNRTGGQISQKGSGVTHVAIATIKDLNSDSNGAIPTPGTNKTSTVNVTSPDNTTSVAPTDGSVVLNGTEAGNGTAKKGDSASPGENKADTNYTGKDKVPFHLARLTNYIVSYKKTVTDTWTNKTVPSNTTELKVVGLTPSTEYIFIVSARYSSNTTISAPRIVATTKNISAHATNCYCNAFGTIGGHKMCNLTLHELPWCKCKPGFIGLFCEMCNSGFYRNAMSKPCHKCPCSTTASSGSCHFVEGYLHCTRCYEGYTGNLCQRCSNGYYKNQKVILSRCTKCVKCHNIRPGLICDPYSGNCLNCHYNTTGHRCDRCLEGFDGDPLNNVSCVVSSAGQKYRPPNTGVIAAICVGVIILLSGIVGFIVYCRMRNYRKQQPFWTVELTDGHEDVHFRSEDYEANDGDDDFGNSYRFKPTSKLAYQKLKT